MFAVIGEALLDMVQPVPAGPYDARPGGGPMNIAVGLQRLGYRTHLMARLSTGPLGAVVRRHVEANELDTSTCVDTDDLTTLAFAALDPQGRASYDFYVNGTADWGWTAEELGLLPSVAQVVHTGSLATVIEPAATAIAELYAGLHAAGGRLLSFDPNVRPALAGSRADAVARVEHLVRSSHVVKASDEDVGWLYPRQPLDDVLEHWLGLGAALVVMTEGPDGCRARSGQGDVVDLPGLTVRMQDTIGAGDAFESGLLSGLFDAGAASPGSIRELTRDALTDVLRRAVRVAGLTCERAGADPPTRAEYAVAAGSADPWI